MNDFARLARHLFGERSDLLAVWSGLRQPGKKDLAMPETRYFRYPDQLDDALEHAARMDQLNREVYFCAHLLLAPQRIKDNAASVLTLWTDVDGADLAHSPIRPTGIVESSPGRQQAYARLTRPVRPEIAEQLNKRWALAFGADVSGYDLSQVLRVPGTHNRKYPGAPMVELVEIDDQLAYDPADLDRILPKLPEPKKATPTRPSAEADPDDERLVEWGRLHLGPVFGRLLEGNYSDYPDKEHPDGNPSKAEHGLFCDLLRLTRGDEERAEELAQSYGTPRDKWNNVHFGDGRTYLEGSIDKARAYLDEDPERWKLPTVEPATSGSDGAETCTCPGCPFRQRLEQIEKAIANPGLDAGTKLVTTGAILELDRRETWKPSKLEQQTGTPDGFKIVSLKRIADRVGMTDRAVSRHLQKAADKAGILRRTEVGLPRGATDPLSGEKLFGPRKYTALQLPNGAAEAFGNLALAKVESDWGGKGRVKGVCKLHPFAGVVEKARRSQHCEACGAQVAQSVQVVLTESNQSRPLSSLPPVVVGPVQDVRTGLRSARDRRAAVERADRAADGHNAEALRERFARIYARAAPSPDDGVPDWVKQGDWATRQRWERAHPPGGSP